MNTLQMLETIAHADRCLSFMDNFKKDAEVLYAKHGAGKHARIDAEYLWDTYQRTGYSIVQTFQEMIQDEVTKKVIVDLVEGCKVS